ncbi:MAG: matrixin family metalloprotease [Planctomycetota bacterium]
MHPQRLFGAVCAVTPALLIALTIMPSGCGAEALPDQDVAQAGSSLSYGEMPPVRSPVPEEEANNAFEAAQPATLPAAGQIIIQGAIANVDDIDVYALGPAVAGDRIIVDVSGNGGLNTVASLFDGNLDLIDASDDRSYYGGQVDPYISQVVRRNTSNLFIGIAFSVAAHFGSGSGGIEGGSYSITVERQPGNAVIPPAHQLVYLDFEGGDSVQIGLEPVVVMRPFSAESISGRLTGKTDYIAGLLVDHMRNDLAPYNVTLVDSKHGAEPTEAHSTLFFGNYNAAYLGLADNVDTGNVAEVQEAIIYAEDLAMWEYLQPSADEVALALANIAAHELGHLLGLEHAEHAGDLMATADTARQVLEIDSTYLRTQLQYDVFPVGHQNGPDQLLLNVGTGGGAGARLRLGEVIHTGSGAWRDDAGLPDIPIVQCSRCAGHH